MTSHAGIRKSKATRICCLILCFLCSRTELFSQTISILGSNCVVAGTQYIYHITGTYASASNVSWSATGGTFTGASSGAHLAQVTVTWSSGSSRSISVNTTSPNGSGNMSIGFSSTLVPGTISNPTQSINYNATPATINCPVPTGGDCGTPTYNYQWQQSTNNVTYTNVSGATSQNLAFSAGLTQTMYYRRMVTVVSTGGTGYSSVATVTVYPAINPGSISPASQTINYNANASLLTLSGVSGGTNSYTYQWQSSPNGSSWSNISGATSTTYTPTALTATTYFQVVVTSNGAPANSSPATVTVYPQVVGGSISPSAPNINYNTSPGLLTLSGVSGGTGTYTYQWQSSPDGSAWTNVSGATGTTYTPGNLTATTWYRVVVTSNGATGNSSSSKVTVYPVLVGGSVIPASLNINYNTGSGTLSLSGITGGNGTYTYQWQSSPDAGTWTNISGATAATYSSPALTARTYYRCVVTSNGVPANSNYTTVNVYPQLVGGSITPNGGQIGYLGSTGTMTLSGVSGGSGTYTYQWQSSPNGSSWTTIGGATATTYSASNVAVSTYYHVIVTSNGASANSSSVLFTVNTVDNLNSIRTREILKPLVTDITTANGLTSNQDVHQTTQYFDGLGRLMQTVSRQSTPAGRDGVAITVYDQYGREATKYLPYASVLNDGFFKLNASTEQSSFNTSQFSGEADFYGQVNYEASPLNRPLTTYAPGVSWVGASRGVTQQYLFNQASDSVRIWDIALAAGSIPRTDSMYRPGALSKMQTTDEAGHSVVEYQRKDGKTVLKKVQLAASPGTGHAGWLSTYYVYDSLQNLRFVIQPRAIDLLQLNGTWNLSSLSNLTNELCFRYEYDNRNRMIIKKVPGAGEVWMIYDQWDRLVLTQDANLRTTNQWLFTKYDGLNRPVLTGLYTDATHNTQSSMQSYLTSQGLGRYENRNTGVQLGYTTTLSFPNLPSMTYSTTDWMTISFYDDYSGGNLFGSAYYTRDNSKDGSFAAASNTTYPYTQTVTEVSATRGQPTIAIARILGTSTAVYRVSFYDSRSRAVQVKTFTAAEATDAASMQYSFDGKPLQTVDYHQKSGTNAQNHTVITKMTYDPGGRLLTVKKNIDAASSDQLIATNRYNELGQLMSKHLGNDLDSLVYNYNIRGWLTSINKNYLAGSVNNYFGMELGYDKSASAAPGASYTGLQYNGNIAGTVWKTAGAGIGRKYAFTYDNVNRLATATFTQESGGTYNTNDHTDFSVNNLFYDANGNIVSMNQYGLKAGASPLIDQLTYTYQANSNKLAKVTDAITDTSAKLGDFHDGTNGGTDDYSYDGNGNLTLDNNKAISSITYNYLNLPQKDSISGKGSVSYIYDASGGKIKKVTYDKATGKTTTTLYYGGFIYQQDTLQFIAHEEGRTRWAWHKNAADGAQFYQYQYDFFEKDHLGNTRVVLTQQKDTAKYLASGEAAYRSTESQLFTNLTQTTTARATAEGYPADLTITNPNDTVFKVSGTTGGHKMGPSLLLKVMSGDKIDIAVQEYYNSGANTTNTSTLTDAIASLATGIVNMSSGGKGSLAQLNNPSSGPVYDALNSFLTNNDPNPSGKPKAYLNWILLDEQLKYVSSYPQSGAVVVGAAGAINPLGYTGIPITRSGYLYIWVSNETQNWNVFFDNLRVAHYTGPMLEETHYYPFGLTMAGISSKALKTNYAQNNFKYNGKELQNQEFSDGTGLEDYDYGARMLDPQLGRFTTKDPHLDKYFPSSPFVYTFNNPVHFSDPTGMDTYLEGEAAQDFYRMMTSMRRHSAETYDHLARLKMQEHAEEKNNNMEIKGVLPVYESITPSIYGHINYAQNIQMYPKILHKDNPSYSENKRNYMRNLWRGVKRPEGYSVDEYPFASTKEGGTFNGRGPSTALVPEWQQQIQSVQILGLMSALKQGDGILVLLISEDVNPSSYGTPYYKVNPDGQIEPAKYLIDRRKYDPDLKNDWDFPGFGSPESLPELLPIPIPIP